MMDSSDLSEVKQLAIVYHQRLCHADHIDICSWHDHDVMTVETWTIDKPHREYLRIARDTLKQISFDSAVKIVSGHA